MKQPRVQAAAGWARAALASALLLSAWSAQAVVSAPDTDLGNGDFEGIHYGAAQDGNVFQLNALLYPGDNLDTQQIKTRVSTLPDFKFDVSSVGPTGAGTSLSEYDYRITNVGSTAHNDLRFMTVLGVDGNPGTLLESVAETWGAPQAGDPSRRQTIAWDDTVENALNNVWVLNRGAPATDGTPVPSACIAPSVCDTFVGLQWDVATLNPGESALIRVGLSDSGQHLSSRFLTITADPTNGISNALTFSGTVTISAVPEPSQVVMLLAGLAAMGSLALRRRSR